MRRHELCDREWSIIEPMLPNKPRGVPRVDDRRVITVSSGASTLAHLGAMFYLSRTCSILRVISLCAKPLTVDAVKIPQNVPRVFAIVSAHSKSRPGIEI